MRKNFQSKNNCISDEYKISKNKTPITFSQFQKRPKNLKKLMVEISDKLALSNKKRENSYVYISPEQNLYEINKFKTKRTDSYNNNNVHYYLPLLPKNKKIVKRNNITDRKDVVSLLKNRNKIKRELIINPVSLDLNSMSNETRINKNLQNKNYRNKVRDNFMEKVKDYRRRLILFLSFSVSLISGFLGGLFLLKSFVLFLFFFLLILLFLFRIFIE